MWIKTNNEISFTASNIEALPEIPVGNWLLKYNEFKGFYLEEAPHFKFPPKIYGDSEQIAKRYLNTFANRNNNLGILLTGLKGTGKSVTAKLTCHNSSRPVILITEPFTGDSFKSFLSNVTQEVVVFTDEFEKVYSTEELQNALLSVLDGIFEGKKMFIFTSNERSRINQYMINRPGRVHYLREYAALDASIISDVIDDNLLIKENKDGLLEILNILSDVTMDMLISLIKEMNLYQETARESVRYLNLRPERVNYNIEVFYKGLKLGASDMNGHPMTKQSLSFDIYCYDLSRYEKGASNHLELIASLNHWKKKSKLLSAPEEVQEINTDYDSKENVKETKCVEIPSAECEKSSESSKEKLKSDTQNEVYDTDAPAGYIRYELNLSECKVNYGDNEINIEDGLGTKIVFSKTQYYSFSF